MKNPLDNELPRRRVLPPWLSGQRGAIAIFSTLYLLVYLAWLNFHWGGEENVTLIGDLVSLPLCLLTALLAWRVVVQKDLNARVRRMYLLLGLGFLAYVIGDVIWAYLENVLQVLPFPSAADIFYLLFLPLLAAGLFAMPSAPLSRRERWQYMADMGIVLITSTMLMWYFVIQPTADASAGDPLAQAISVAYPIGDVIIIFGILGALLRKPDRDTRSALWLIFLGMLFFVGADVIYAYTSLAGTYVTGSWIDAGWTIAFLFFLLAALRQLYCSPAGSQDSRWVAGLDRFAQALPMIVVVLGSMVTVTIVVFNLTQQAGWLLVGAGLSIVLLIARQFRNYSLRTKFVLAFSLTATSVAIVTALVYYNSQYNQALQEYRNRVTNAVAIAALQQDGDEFARIASAQDPLYEKFRVQNLKIRRTDLQFVFVYTLRKDEDGLYFVVDAGEPGEKDFSAFGDRYDEPSATLTDNFDTMTAAVADPEIYSDEFGAFISAYAPIFTADGERAGVIGVDISADTITQNQRQLLAQTLLIVFLTGLLSLILGYAVGNLLVKPVRQLTAETDMFVKGDFSFRTTVSTEDEVGALGRSFNLMADQIQALVSGLEQRVADRTEELRASADVGRAAASILQTDQLLGQIVNLIVDRFGLYYAAVFTLDKAGKNAVLREATGQAGRVLKERSHQLEVGGQSMVGYAMAQRTARIALDVGAEAVRFANPLLPDTRSEIALPLMVGDRVLGALDVQSTRVAAFDDASAAVLQSMADQIAVALSNAEQFKQTDTALQRARDLYAASQALSAAADPADVLDTLINHIAPDADRAGIMRFGPRQADGQVSYVEFVAAWVHPEFSSVMQPIQIGARFTPQQMPLVKYVAPGRPLIVPDDNDPALDPSVRGLMQRFGAQAFAALPLTVGQQTLGIVVVGYRTPRQFDVDQLQAMQALTGQAATVLQNIQSAADTQAALAQLDAVNRRLTGEAWVDFARRRTVEGVRWIGTTDRAQQTDLPEVSMALSSGQIATRALDSREQLGVAVPIKLRDVPIGALRVVVPDTAWNDELRATLDSIAGHVAQAAENARLLEETERNAHREQTINEINTRVRQTIDLDAILKTAVSELGQSLKAARVVARVGPVDNDSKTGRARGNDHA